MGRLSAQKAGKTPPLSRVTQQLSGKGGAQKSPPSWGGRWEMGVGSWNVSSLGDRVSTRCVPQAHALVPRLLSGW